MAVRKRQRLPDEVLLVRLTSKRFIDPTTECWIWTGAKHRHGYGSLWDGIRCATVSRISAQIYLGLALDDKRFVCHRCDVPACFNPAHLFIGTQKDNWRDCWEKGRAHRLPPRTIEQSGEKNAQAKLTWDKVRQIRSLWHVPGWSQHRIARELGVTQSLVSMIINNIVWKHEEELH